MVPRTVADRLMAEALELADGKAINCRALDQVEESSRSFEINVSGKPMRIGIVVSTLEIG